MQNYIITDIRAIPPALAAHDAQRKKQQSKQAKNRQYVQRHVHESFSGQFGVPETSDR